MNRAASLVSEHFDAGGDPADLKRALGRGLLREDAGFHTIQTLTWGIERFDALAGRDGDDLEQRLALIAPARYMAAHFPTRRKHEGTVFHRNAAPPRGATPRTKLTSSRT